MNFAEKGRKIILTQETQKLNFTSIKNTHFQVFTHAFGNNVIAVSNCALLKIRIDISFRILERVSYLNINNIRMKIVHILQIKTDTYAVICTKILMIRIDLFLAKNC